MKKLILLITLVLLSYNTVSIENHLIDENYIKELDYEVLINYIKFVEGFCEKPTKCPAGYKTIGFGHLMTKPLLANRISIKASDSLLRIDLNKLRDGLLNKDKLNEHQIQAILCFMYNLGPNAYKRSSLKKLIDKNSKDTINIKRQWLKYCFYKKPNSNYIKSKALFKRRLWEYKLFIK